MLRWLRGVGRPDRNGTGLGYAVEAGVVSSFLEIAKPLMHGDVEGKREAQAFAEVRRKL